MSLYGSEEAPIFTPHTAGRNWFQRNSNFLMGVTIVILLACIGITVRNNGFSAEASQFRLSTGDVAETSENESAANVKVGGKCAKAEECKPCANPLDHPQCTPDKSGKNICKCKEHRLYPGEQCVAFEECKLCKGKDEHRHCTGTPKVCKCEVEYFTAVGGKCSKDEECNRCVDEKDTPHCVPDKSGENICKCKDHRLYPGEQCYAAEECKLCKKEGEVLECTGHPQVCNCKYLIPFLK